MKSIFPVTAIIIFLLLYIVPLLFGAHPTVESPMIFMGIRVANLVGIGGFLMLITLVIGFIVGNKAPRKN